MLMSDNDDNQGGSGSGSGGRSGGSRTVVKMGNVFYAYGDHGTQSKKNTQQSPNNHKRRIVDAQKTIKT